ncbi:hypothetical protein B0H16DRAFT_1687183 [Mycena metata]|uniref:Uncharacterized protein n=1 Tax=Mycena metata TaxID=1033252 RepID=A0AAD7NLP5_9AGAR|nr:hypothetical protein B0H16DRAFT_1687183 [Mycena metata]
MERRGTDEGGSAIVSDEDMVNGCYPLVRGVSPTMSETARGVRKGRDGEAPRWEREAGAEGRGRRRQTPSGIGFGAAQWEEKERAGAPGTFQLNNYVETKSSVNADSKAPENKTSNKYQSDTLFGVSLKRMGADERVNDARGTRNYGVVYVKPQVKRREMISWKLIVAEIVPRKLGSTVKLQVDVLAVGEKEKDEASRTCNNREAEQEQRRKGPVLVRREGPERRSRDGRCFRHRGAQERLVAENKLSVCLPRSISTSNLSDYVEGSLHYLPAETAGRLRSGWVCGAGDGQRRGEGESAKSGGSGYDCVTKPCRLEVLARRLEMGVMWAGGRWAVRGGLIDGGRRVFAGGGRGGGRNAMTRWQNRDAEVGRMVARRVSEVGEEGESKRRKRK